MLLIGCSNPDDSTAIAAEEFIGLHERYDRQELKDVVGVDPVRTEWCAAFVNAMLELDGFLNNNDHKYPLTARAFLDWGVPVEPEDIQKGDIVIFPRGNQGWQGHVGFYIGNHSDSDRWVILGGNQSNSVRYDLYNPRRALGIRRAPAQVTLRPSWRPY